MAGANIDMLDALGKFIMTLGTPWVIGCDWNMGPEAISSSGWLDRIGGAMVSPSCHTCSKGMGNTLDYFVVAQALRQLVKVIEVWEDAPISPHPPVKMIIGGVRLDAKASQR
eukprot:3805006-Heterocapsa_arctica.AAC.1